jgi:hypothetical protein
MSFGQELGSYGVRLTYETGIKKIRDENDRNKVLGLEKNDTLITGCIVLSEYTKLNVSVNKNWGMITELQPEYEDSSASYSGVCLSSVSLLIHNNSYTIELEDDRRNLMYMALGTFNQKRPKSKTIINKIYLAGFYNPLVVAYNKIKQNLIEEHGEYSDEYINDLETAKQITKGSNFLLLCYMLRLEKEKGTISDNDIITLKAAGHTDSDNESDPLVMKKLVKYYESIGFEIMDKEYVDYVEKTAKSAYDYKDIGMYSTVGNILKNCSKAKTSDEIKMLLTDTLPKKKSMFNIFSNYIKHNRRTNKKRLSKRKSLTKRNSIKKKKTSKRKSIKKKQTIKRKSNRRK